MPNPRSARPPLLAPRLALLLGLGCAACQPLEPRPAASGARAPAPRAAGQKKQLGIDELYDPEKHLDLDGQLAQPALWLDDEHYLVARKEPKGARSTWMRVEAASGREEPFGDAARARQALLTRAGAKEQEAARLAEQDPARMSADHGALLCTIRKDLYVWLAATDKLVRLTNTPNAEEEQESFSPDGKRVAFVRDNDLYVCDIDPPAERRLTRDGSATLLNGKLDWLYQEELYGRGHFKAYWWSPDSDEIAFLQLDEKGVPLWTLVDDVPRTPLVENAPYPRAGEENPKVHLGIVPVTRPEVRWVDLSRWSAAEPLLVDVSWLDEERVGFQVQDREQTWLELASASSKEPAPRTLLREESKGWVESHGAPRKLADGTFLWLSERTGWKHAYHYTADWKLIGALTSGEWELRSIDAVDETNGWVYVSGTQRSAVDVDVCRARLDGSRLERLSEAAGTHKALFNPHCTRYLDVWSDLWTPPQLRLHACDGREERLIEAASLPQLEEYELARAELLQVKARDGFVMDAILLRPPGFDPKHRYPVYQMTYAGPHAPQVRNAWNAGPGLFGQLLAERGVIVWVCDNRSASGQGLAATLACYQRFGESELADIEDGLAWLKSQSWVDAARIGIGGWSFGGFMSCYALTHSKSFCMGIAGGSVTDWRNYDSIYTERYMRLPKNNEKGYAETSVLKAAKDLHGALLLVHGAMDDNVHAANTRQLANELQKEQKSFQELFYAGQRHGLTNPQLVRHWRAASLEFIERWLLRR